MDGDSGEHSARIGISHDLRVLLGGPGGSNPDKAGPSRTLGRDMVGKAAKMPPKTRPGARKLRARGATLTAAWGTWAQLMTENVTYFKHSQNIQLLVSNQGAPNATQSERF